MKKNYLDLGWCARADRKRERKWTEQWEAVEALKTFLILFYEMQENPPFNNEDEIK